jgi:hypothetical protein
VRGRNDGTQGSPSEPAILTVSQNHASAQSIALIVGYGEVGSNYRINAQLDARTDVLYGSIQPVAVGDGKGGCTTGGSGLGK